MLPRQIPRKFFVLASKRLDRLSFGRHCLDARIVADAAFHRAAGRASRPPKLQQFGPRLIPRSDSLGPSVHAELSARQVGLGLFQPLSRRAAPLVVQDLQPSHQAAAAGFGLHELDSLGHTGKTGRDPGKELRNR